MSDEGSRSPAVRAYNDTNRAFLQGILARGSFTLNEAKELLAAIFSIEDGQTISRNQVSDADFTSYLSAAGDALSPFDYEIRNGLHQETRTRIYALVNSTSDPLTHVATTRSPEEMTYVRRLLDGMFETYNTRRAEVMALDPFQALQLAKPSSRDRDRERDRRSAVSATAGMDDDTESVGDDSVETVKAVDRGLSSTQAERVLEGLVEEGFFERSSEGWYSLSVRGLLELRSWLIATYNDPDAEEDSWQRIKFCVACKELLTVGQRCRDPDCDVRLHDICQAAFWRTRRGAGTEGTEHRCPACNEPWDGKSFVGERAVTTRKLYADRRRGRGEASNVAAPTEDDEVSE